LAWVVEIRALKDRLLEKWEYNLEPPNREGGLGSGGKEGKSGCTLLPLDHLSPITGFEATGNWKLRGGGEGVKKYLPKSEMRSTTKVVLGSSGKRIWTNSDSRAPSSRGNKLALGHRASHVE